MIQKQNRILVIDDDRDIGSMLTRIFVQHGFKVTFIENADRIIEMMQKKQVDLLLLDMLLPGANGADICAAIKKDPTISGIPVIMMSAHPDAGKICLKAGADDFIAKPFLVKVLLDKISHFIEPGE